jgi:2-methylcitrate dehydratase PrpD
MITRTDLAPVVAWLYDADPLAAPAVDEKARLLLLDTLGCFVAALVHDEPRALARELQAHAPGAVVLPGIDAGAGLSPFAAAFLLAVGACWDEACEGLGRAHGRPGLHAVPAALACSLKQDRDLATALRAIVVGYEVGARLGEYLKIKPGMHVDGSWGAMGAAAAAACAFDEDRDTLLTAVDTAACQVPFSLYLPVAEGVNARNIYCGHGVTLGLQAAISARAGIAAPESALAQYGEIALGGRTHKAVPTGAGEFLILEGYLKRFAAVRHVHYGIQAALEWRMEEGSETREISAIDLTVYEEAIRYCNNRSPVTPIQGQFSLSYGIACALVTGDVKPDAYSPERMRDEEIRRLEALVSITTDKNRSRQGERGASMVITRAGIKRRMDVNSVPGDPDQPFDQEQALAKFLSYTGPVIGTDRAHTIADGILSGNLDRSLKSLLSA